MGNQKRKDTLYDTPLGDVPGFTFDQSVAAVFDDMIERSVPLYREVQEVSAAIAQQFYRPGTSIYDLGCSTGTSLLACLARLKDSAELHLVGVDNSSAMLAKCRANLNTSPRAREVQLVEAELDLVTIRKASVVLLNYTLQFVAPESRLEVLTRIFHGMVPGGVIVLSEKVSHGPGVSEVVTSLHHDFKRRNGYSDLEISQKRQALEDILIPLSTDENTRLLRAAGFDRVEIVLKSYNFATFLGIKSENSVDSSN